MGILNLHICLVYLHVNVPYLNLQVNIFFLNKMAEVSLIKSFHCLLLFIFIFIFAINQSIIMIICLYCFDIKHVDSSQHQRALSVIN